MRSFTGREAELHELLERLKAAPRAALVPAAALYGMGGIGKTQLARAFAHQHRAQYTLGWWVPAETPLEARAALAALAIGLGDDPTQKQSDLVRHALNALSDRDDWLLIFDNATVPADLEPLLPAAGGGQVLITSRTPAWHGIADPVPVDLFTLEEAATLLQTRTGDPNLQAAERLAKALDRLPLAVEQAAAYAADQQISLAAYLELFTQKRAELLALGRPLAYEGTVDTTVMLTVTQLAQANPAALHLLQVCALLAPDALPIDQLLEHADRLGDPLALAAHDPRSRAELVGVLRRISLVVADPDGTSRVHRLVQAVVLGHLPAAARDTLLTHTIDLLRALWPADPRKATEPVYERLLAHVDTVSAHAREQQLSSPALADLLTCAGLYMWARGVDPTAARELFQQALAMYRRLYGETADHPDIAQSLINLALPQRRLGGHHRIPTCMSRPWPCTGGCTATPPTTPTSKEASGILQVSYEG